jgi:exonuclease SbcC
MQFDRKRIAEAIALKENYIISLRTAWDAINKEVFQFDDTNCVCPTCKQQLPVENIEKQKETLLANFNQSKIQRKQEKVDESTRVKTEKSNLEKQLSELNESALQQQITEQQNKISSLENKLTNARAEAAKNTVSNVEFTVNELLKLNGDALNLQDEISELNNQIASATDKLAEDDDNYESKKEKALLQTQVDHIKNQLALRETIEQTDRRIEQLLHEESENAQAIADVEKHENEIEQFTRAKNDIVQEKVNKLFRYVQFRLFQKQVNGEIAETCVCEYKGVPYPTLNTAAKLLAGIDVLNTLSSYYQKWAPVFCDNRESVSWIPESKSQLISLYVSPEHKKLTIEMVGKKEMVRA